MSENHEDGWTISTTKAYIEKLLAEQDRRYEQRFKAQEEAVKMALDANKEAVLKAEANTAKWQQNANEWRAAMSDKDKLLVTRNEHNLLSDRIDAVTKVVAASVFLAIALVTVILLVLKH